MGKGKISEEKRGMLVGVFWSCADVKHLLTFLLFLCSLATLIQLFPASRYSLPSPSNLTSCFSFSLKISSPPSLNLSSTPASDHHPLTQEEQVSAGVIKRAFNPIGTAAYLFIQMGAYRGGLNSFAVVGLGSKPLHVFAKPQFQCEWIPHNDNNGSGSGSGSVTVHATKILPDWGYGRVYTVVVVNCTFPSPVGVGAGADASGGRLLLRPTTGGGGDRKFDLEERMVALEESPGTVNASVYTSAPKYEYLYCSSSLYGNVSPQRVREWMAYHARLFGERSHFVFHDAGGVHPAVMEVLRPWIDKGMVTLQDIREQERFDGYYHNQFLVVNDCLHRYRFAAKWAFFFDVDEFIYIQPRNTLASLLNELSGYTQFTIEQMPMSSKVCLSTDGVRTPRMWGIEKLVYRDVKRGLRRDRKYAIQPRSALATGVHMSQNVAGRTLHKSDRRIVYFHYHGTTANRREPCRVFANATEVTVDGTPYVRDDTLRKVAGSVKQFELKAIGSRLQRTRQ